MSLKQIQDETTGAGRKRSKQTNKSIIIISLLLLIIYSFLHNKTQKLETKNNSKTFSKIQRKYHQCFRNWAENRTKK
jgi:uncharacterized membrane protein (DUF106 family)